MSEVVKKVGDRSIEELIERFEQSLEDIREGRTEDVSSADGSQ